MTPDAALAEIAALSVPGKATDMAAYHKVKRPYLGVANPDIDALTRHWRQTLSLGERLDLASGLWHSNVHEGRIAAAKLLTQARIRPDDTGAWSLIASWVPTFDGWAVADHASIAGQKRLVGAPDRLARERILGWAEGYIDDQEWFIQKAVAWWLRDLSKRDSGRVRQFLKTHGDRMKPFARKEAARHLD